MRNAKYDAHKIKIDFVLPWVDGSDREWLAQKCKYLESANKLSHNPEANADNRYRDYGLLKYWFRGVERFAPWVNQVFFVTCGQKPDWLNESHPKLRLVNHKDYIPADYLPTFQSNTIELNLHRIADLSERFVLFNDDTFLLRPVEPEFFFRKGLPVLPCDLRIPYWLASGGLTTPTLTANSAALSRSLNVKHLVWSNIWKYADVYHLGFRHAAKNILSFVINGIVIPGSFGHLPQPHLKSTFDEIWQKQPHILDATSRNRFRTDDCVNQWLACAWDMISGRFYPANANRRGMFVTIDDSKYITQICDAIRQQTSPMLCISEKNTGPEMEQCFLDMSQAFGKLLPEKSSFEK